MVYSPLALVIALYLPIEFELNYLYDYVHAGIWLKHPCGEARLLIQSEHLPLLRIAPSRAVGTGEGLESWEYGHTLNSKIKGLELYTVVELVPVGKR